MHSAIRKPYSTVNTMMMNASTAWNMSYKLCASSTVVPYDSHASSGLSKPQTSAMSGSEHGPKGGYVSATKQTELAMISSMIA